VTNRYPAADRAAAEFHIIRSGPLHLADRRSSPSVEGNLKIVSNALPDLTPNDTTYGSHDRRDETIEGRKVVIGGGDVCDQLLNCRFIDCEIRIKCAGRMTGVALSGCSFKDCMIWPSKIQKIVHLNADFHSCRFKGTYEIEFHGEVSDCTFEEARLNYALFYKPVTLDLRSVPRWPHIVVTNLTENGGDFMASVPKLSSLWIMARKHSHSMVVNLEKECDDIDQTWNSLKEKDYIKYRTDGE